MNSKLTQIFIRIIGWGLLLAGVFLMILAPYEATTFSYFKEGGRFHYQGYGIGSLMFLIILAQVEIYGLVGILFFFLGLGHIRAKAWIPAVMQGLLIAWWIIGLPVCLMAFFVLAGAKDLTPVGGIFWLVILFLLYTAFPYLILRYYRSKALLTFLNPSASESYPPYLAAILMMEAIMIIIFNLLVFTNGIFPFFGKWLNVQTGIMAGLICMVYCGVLIWGSWCRFRWSWWAGLTFIGLFCISSLVTFLQTDYLQLLGVMGFPPYDVEILDGIPARGYHFAILSGLPLTLLFLLLLRSRNLFHR